MAAIANLYAKYAFDSDLNNWPLPVVLLVHGWGGDADSFDGDDTLARLAALKLFVVSVGMRGRNGADGSRDASGREIYDLYDALTQIRADFPTIAHASNAAIVGYSGGGGNALAAAGKFPDAFTVVVSYFGMSDYGRDGVDGWYYNSPGDYPAEIAASVGDTPINVPDAYYARDAVTAIDNFNGGYLYMYHDTADTIVPVAHSTRVKSALDSASLTNYSYNESEAGDPVRWTHKYPADNADLKTAESTWGTAIRSHSAWTVNASGTVTVIGYIVTKRFSVWLGSTTEYGGGLDEVATVEYDTETGQYTVTPLTGACDVFIRQGTLTATASGIVGETLLTVA